MTEPTLTILAECENDPPPSEALSEAELEAAVLERAAWLADFFGCPVRTFPLAPNIGTVFHVFNGGGYRRRSFRIQKPPTIASTLRSVPRAPRHRT